MKTDHEYIESVGKEFRRIRERKDAAIEALIWYWEAVFPRSKHEPEAGARLARAIISMSIGELEKQFGKDLEG